VTASIPNHPLRKGCNERLVTPTYHCASCDMVCPTASLLKKTEREESVSKLSVQYKRSTVITNAWSLYFVFHQIHSQIIDQMYVYTWSGIRGVRCIVKKEVESSLEKQIMQTWIHKKWTIDHKNSHSLCQHPKYHTDK
jgi:hypothetical protein